MSIRLFCCCREVPGSGNLITFGQFLLVSVVTLPGQIEYKSNSVFKWGFKSRRIPLWRWTIMVGLFFLTSLLNNMAFNYKIALSASIIIFRKSSGPGSQHLGFWMKLLFGISGIYCPRQVVAVAYDGHSRNCRFHPQLLIQRIVPSVTATSGNSDYVQWLTGILILTAGIVAASFLGLYQEFTYKIYGKAWKEGLFYSHSLALPLFSFFYLDITRQIVATQASPAISSTSALPSPLGGIPIGWIYLWCQCHYPVSMRNQAFTDYRLCLRLWLSNLVLNLRKMSSLALSVFLFKKNPFYFAYVLGLRVLVFSGTFLYSMSPSPSSIPTNASTASETKKDQQS